MTDVREEPFLFTGGMVRKLRDRSKTQTRRMITQRNSFVDGESFQKRLWPSLQLDKAWLDPGPSPAGNEGPYLKCPWQHPDDARPDERVSRVYPRLWSGDRVWVKETMSDKCPHWPHWCGCGSKEMVAELHTVQYRADDPDAEPTGWRGKWSPSIHMPRWASRITLPLTEVRPERVQDISEADAEAEGAEPVEWSEDFGGGPFDGTSYREGFRLLWDSINSHRPGCSWNDNPWTWAYSFEPPS